MPFLRVTLPQLVDRIDADLESRLGLGPFPRRSTAGAYARMIAGSAHHLHGHLDWISRQVLPDTAEREFLDRHASLWGIFRQQATLATGTVLFTGTGTPTIPSGTRVRTAPGVEYETTSTVQISGGQISAPVQAVEAGDAGNADTGTIVSLVTPIAGVDADATVESPGLSGGTNTETDDELLARLLLEIRRPPLGGATQDYEKWVLETPGVPATRAWALEAHLGPGTVGVAFATDGAPSGTVPTQAMVDDVQAYVDARRPVTAQTTVFAPTNQQYTVTLSSLTPNEVEVQGAILLNVSEFVRAEGGPGQTLLFSQLQEAIATAPGVLDYTLSAPTGDVVVGAGSIAILSFNVP